MKTEYKIIPLSIILGLFVWVIDALLDYLIFYEGTFWALLIYGIPGHKIYIRTVILGTFLVFGALIAGIMAKRKRAAGKKKQEITFTAEEAVFRDVLARKHVLRCHVHKIDDIATLLRIVDEFKLKVTVEHAGDVHEPEIFAELKRRGIPVICGPLDSIAYKVEL